MSTSLTVLIIAVGLFFVSLIYSTLADARKITRDLAVLPWAGTDKNSVWSLIKCRIKNMLTFKRDFELLYRTTPTATSPLTTDQYWLHGKAVFVPLIMGDAVLLPHSEYSWIVEQPDDILNAFDQISEEIQTQATLVDKYVESTHLHLTVITRDLTRQLANLTDDVYDEVSVSIDHAWGVDTNDWQLVNPFTSIADMVSRASNRVFVGKPLCRNTELTRSAVDFASTVMPIALILRRFPVSMRPAIAKIVGFKNRAYRRKISAILESEIAARQEESRINPRKSAAPNEHNDFLQWTIKLASESDDPRQSDPSIIAQRLILVNFAAIHTSTITLTNAIYDLVSSPDYTTVIEALREEVSSVLASTKDGKWTKQAVADLRKHDSLIRESTRLSPISVFSVTRRVMVPGGITTPISHTFLPEGTSVAVPRPAIHRDPNTYEDPNVFKPFRFIEMRDHTSANLNMSNTSLQYATFGHGRHACPGRFFATLELKLMLAYMVQNYDFEVLETRPENMWAGQTCIPPVKNTIKVRRRVNL